VYEYRDTHRIRIHLPDNDGTFWRKDLCGSLIQQAVSHQYDISKRALQYMQWPMNLPQSPTRASAPTHLGMIDKMCRAGNTNSVCSARKNKHSLGI